jgi:diguanylate cyclase (GGDEF)-like protein
MSMNDLGERPIQVLLVEADGPTVEDLKEAFRRVRGYVVELIWVGELAGALARLSQGGIDAVLLDPALPDSEGISSFERLFAFAPEVPIIVLTEDGDDELAVRTVQWGAQDYLLKGDVNPGVVVRSVRYAIERHRLLSALKRLSLIDDLTNLYNRRGFIDLGEQYLRLGRRTGREITVVYVDIDRIKTINDTLGHHVGDRALLRVADTLRSTFRSSDLIARADGDEFAVLALETAGEDAESLVNRLRSKIAGLNAQGIEPYHLSISVGIARYSGEGRARLDEMLSAAREALIDEKAAKRIPVAEEG